MDLIFTFLKNYGLPCILLLFVLVVLFTWAIKSKQENVFQKSIAAGALAVLGVCILSFFINFINMKHVGYGYSTSRFKLLAVGDNVLWGLDDFTKNEGPTLGRVQALDLDCGKKLFRKIASQPIEFIGYRKHLMWFAINNSLKNIVGMDPLTGKERVATNGFDLIKKIPEFSSAICKLSPVIQYSLSLTIAKGLRIGESAYEDVLNMYSVKILEHKTNKREYGLRPDKSLYYDPTAETYIAVTYTTPSRKEFMVSYHSKKGHLIWNVRQAEIEVGDFFNESPAFEKVFVYGDNLIFIFDGFVFSLANFNGQLNWLTRV